MEKREWHAIDVESVLETLGTTRKGISDREASERLDRFGPNELREEKKVTPFELFVGQFKSILVVILIISAVVSAYLAIQEGAPMTDTWVILIIVVMNAVLGFVQEYRAEKAVEALKAMVSPHVLVLRDTTEKSIDSKDLVPGDIVLLEAGVVIVEGLDLRGVPPGHYQLICLPLKLVGCDGAPARAVLIKAIGHKLRFSVTCQAKRPVQP